MKLKMTIECIGVERDLITELLNPNIPELKRRQPQLAGLKFAEEHSSERYLPVHILLGVQDYQRIRTPKLPIFGRNLKTDPVAEYTKLGWILSGGRNPLTSAQGPRGLCNFNKIKQPQLKHRGNMEFTKSKDLNKRNDVSKLT